MTPAGSEKRVNLSREGEKSGTLCEMGKKRAALKNSLQSLVLEKIAKTVLEA